MSVLDKTGREENAWEQKQNYFIPSKRIIKFCDFEIFLHKNTQIYNKLSFALLFC